ncbi:MAG TPA: MBL fold metallo-hydrolase [Candidatus Sulfotelmatobacter sp.]|nr:MBL fold metallo-hydrolase [Candidatus Sulfotelmatobacter sp.]
MRALPAILLAAWCAGCAGGAPSPAAPDEGPYVLVLGTAQDGGLPHVACTCVRCEAARRNPALRRRVASLALIVPATGRRYLIDATPDIREQIDALPAVGSHPRGSVDRAPVDGVLLTHAHAGHILGLALFGFEAVHTRHLPVYATPRLSGYLRTNGPWARMVAREEIDLRETAYGASVPLDHGVRVIPLAVPHRDEDSDTVGYRIEGPRRTLLYVPDTDGWSAWDPPLTRALEGCDVALLDGTFGSADELPGRDVSKIGHPLIGDTMRLLEEPVRSKRVAVYFTHLNHSNDTVDPKSAAAERVRAAGFAIAAEGQRFPL